MIVRRPLCWSIAAVIALGLCLAAVVGSAAARRRPALASPIPTLPLLPLARGQLLVSIGDPPACQLLVSIGDPPSWQPVTGTPVTVTLLSGGPAVRKTAGLNAYVGFQSTGRSCPDAARGDRGTLVTMLDFYAPTNLVLAGSPFAPTGGAHGDYAVSIPQVVLSGHRRIRACIWMARSERRRSRPVSQDIPVLNGLLAASVSNVPSAGGGTGAAYTLNAFGVGVGFSYSIATVQCSVVSPGQVVHVAPGTAASAAVSLLRLPCATDASRFTISSAGGIVGALEYPASDARSSPPGVVSLGGCELDPVTATTPTAAIAYVQADGCSVARLLLSPYQPGLPAGDVLEAQVDGGIAEAAPLGTPVDLVLNGRPLTQRDRVSKRDV
jgi:hypothetical protein